MISRELSEAAVEFNTILLNSAETINKKIPVKFKDFLKNIEAENYIFNYDKTKKLKEQNIKPETRGLIAIVYQEYLCNEEEKKEYNKKVEKFYINEEKIKKEKYNPDDIFKKKHQKNNVSISYNNNNENSSNSDKGMIEYRNSLFIRILRKIFKR